MKLARSVFLVAVCALGCKQSLFSPPPLELVVAYGSEKKTWFEEQARSFEAQQPPPGQRPIRIKGLALGSGEAVQGILSGRLRPHVFSPASSAYITLLNQAWLSQPGHTAPLCPAGEPLLLSPIVIAMWRPMAEALGWPGKALGWRDLLKVSQSDKGWGALGHAGWGRFKLGHTHPEFSNSGFLAVLAEAYAGAGKKRELLPEDLDRKETQAFLTAAESTIVHYGKSTGFFADKMIARGPGYLSAAVLYENLVVESYGKAWPPIVALYPVEGTFWSDHPYAVPDAEWVGAAERKAAAAFLAFLKQRPQQERALALGFRPADPAIPIAAPLDLAHGVDPKQPQNLLEVPAAATLDRLLAAWRRTKKATSVTLVFDTSGSMQGRPLEEAKRGALAFLGNLTDRDQAGLLLFSSAVQPLVGPLELGAGRTELLRRLAMADAGGATLLYDATAAAYAAAVERAAADRRRIHAVVVMTDGEDNGSRLGLEALKQHLAGDAEVAIFTIAYGDEARGEVLKQIADAGRGSFQKGSVETIVQVYQDVASFF